MTSAGGLSPSGAPNAGLTPSERRTCSSPPSATAAGAPLLVEPLDWRTLVGVAAATIALLSKQDFLVVFIIAITVTAALRVVSSSAHNSPSQLGRSAATDHSKRPRQAGARSHC
jgi:hypothetical protein